MHLALKASVITPEPFWGRCWQFFCSTGFTSISVPSFIWRSFPACSPSCMVLLVKERRAALAAKAKIDVSLRQFPTDYWKYLLVTALFGLGNSSNAFLILRTQDIGVRLEATILIYAAFNLVAALISYPAGSLSDRWGARNVLLVSFVIFLIGYLGFALTQNVAFDRRAFCILRPVPGNISHGRKGVGVELRSGRICAPAELAGTTRLSECCNSSRAWLPACFGTVSGTSPFSITARSSLSSELSHRRSPDPKTAPRPRLTARFTAR